MTQPAYEHLVESGLLHSQNVELIIRVVPQ